MPKASASAPFRVFERVVISLYDGGVLSPAVLERVIGAFAHAGADWRSAPDARSVDGRSLHEIVVLTMLPGEGLDSASTSFMTVAEHVAGASQRARAVSANAGEDPPARARARKQPKADEDPGAAERLAQLSSSVQPDKRGRSTKASPPARSNSFNPFLNAALPRARKP
ncbi:hypothetical protein [Paraburkholderia aromaticivorans]|uniref:Uncharacterized protein n=1 Tax=Paraburkholderia aromaticivorans TaxID=2026199 RepID=A0A248VKS6_9BURK|nr:hypothetical protein [Paraburkholderia aromaticivorans]ASV99019.1 hypothetical protein CJU94_13175 [Paraburkholderia aromaticivorans]